MFHSCLLFSAITFGHEMIAHAHICTYFELVFRPDPFLQPKLQAGLCFLFFPPFRVDAWGTRQYAAKTIAAVIPAWLLAGKERRPGANAHADAVCLF